jgi:hypothetical protein
MPSAHRDPIPSGFLRSRRGDRDAPRPAPTDRERSEALAHNLERLAWLMDRSVTIPGTRITLGLDALLGLLPVGGDVLAGLVQTGLVLVALAHYKVPKHVAMRMAANVLIDVAIGAIPVLGDLFDVAFKANTRNLRLLERYRRPAEPSPGWTEPLSVRDATPPPRRGMPVRYLVAIGLVLTAVLGLVFLGFLTLVRWMMSGGGSLF